jgi:hypothetical protein
LGREAKRIVKCVTAGTGRTSGSVPRYDKARLSFHFILTRFQHLRVLSR